MGTIQKFKLGINGIGRIGRLVANEKSVGVFGVKSSEEIPLLAKTLTEFAVCSNRVINGNENSTAQSKVINGSNTVYSFAEVVHFGKSEIRRTVHGPSIMGVRIGRVASFCTIPSTTEDTKIVESVQLGLNADEIKKDDNSTEFNPKAGPTKPAISLFPFSGSDLFYLRDGAGLYNNLFIEDARENYVGQLRKKCFNLMGRSEKVMELVEKCIAQNGPGALTKEIEMMIELILRSNKVPYGCNSYLNEVKKMRSLVSNSTNTKTSVESVKLRSVYQSASMIAQDICAQLRSKTQFRVIFGKIIREIPMEMKNGVEGIRVTCSGRINGAEIARTECGKYGKTSRTTFSQKVDYACAEALTRSGLIGVKVWISYRKNRTGRPSPSVEV